MQVRFLSCLRACGEMVYAEDRKSLEIKKYLFSGGGVMVARVVISIYLRILTTSINIPFGGRNFGSNPDLLTLFYNKLL